MEPCVSTLWVSIVEWKFLNSCSAHCVLAFVVQFALASVLRGCGDFRSDFSVSGSQISNE